MKYRQIAAFRFEGKLKLVTKATIPIFIEELLDGDRSTGSRCRTEGVLIGANGQSILAA